MPDVHTSEADETLIRDILNRGFRTPNAPKNRVMQVAIARSLQISVEPDEALDRIDQPGKPYDLEQITGRGKRKEPDFDDATRALLSCYHDTDLFADESLYIKLLQRHMRRGLDEFRRSWRVGHDFHAYLYQDLFAGLKPPAEPEDTQAGLKQALSDIGVIGDIRDLVQGPRLTRYQVYLEDVNHHDKLKRGLEKLALSLGLQKAGVTLEKGDGPKLIYLDVPRTEDTWKPLVASELAQWITPEAMQKSLLPVWPGVDALGKPFMFDLAKSPHLLVAGTTGSGKSVCLHALILSLIQTHNPRDLKLVLIDPKQVEFAPYAGLAHLHGEPIHDQPETAIEILEELVNEMQRRTDALKQAGVANLQDARNKEGLDLPYIVVFVEELADLFMQTQEVEQPLVRLAQKARAMGIHLVLATQRPDSATFTGLLRSNIPARIALSVQKSSESKIILDDTGAEKLLGKGDMLIKPQAGAEPTRVHGVVVTRDDIAQAIRNNQEASR